MSIGERIRLARELTGATQTDWARLAGTSQASWARVERGTIGATDVIVEVAARESSLPLTFFSEPSRIAQIGETGSSLYREHSRLTLRERKRAVAWSRLGWNTLERAARDGDVGLPRLRLPSAEAVYGKEVEDAAAITRNALDLTADEPVGHLTRRLEKAGVRVLPVAVQYEQPKVNRGIDGLSDWYGPHAIIGMSVHTSGDRQRMTLAHEVGHLVLHPQSGDGKRLEREANEFAGALLMPRRAFEDLFPTGQPVTVSELAELKRHWKCSMAAIIIRAWSLRLIDRDEKVRLFRMLSTRGWRTKEPVEVPRERTALITSVAKRAYGSTDARQLANRLSLNPFQVATLLDKAPTGGPVLGHADIISIGYSSNATTR